MAQETKSRYCYRCGKRVGHQMDRCYFCSAPTRRVIRPSRLCPFCQEEIGHRAIKCPHCGEFTDGRPSQQQQPQPSMTFVIDKAVIGGGQGPQQLTAQVGADGRPVIGLGGQPMFEPGGQQPLLPGQAGAPPAPAGSAGLLPASTEPPPELLPPEQSGVSPAAPDAPIPDMQPPAQQGQGGSALAPYQGQGGSNLAPYQGQGGAPLAPYQGQGGAPLAPYEGTVHPLAQASPGGAMAPYEEPQSRPLDYPIGAIGSVASTTQDDSRYFTCPLCDTEALSSDNYCFNCGQIRGDGDKLDPQLIAAARSGSNVALYFFSVLFIGVFAALREAPLPEDLTKPLYQGLVATIGLLLPVWAFVRRRTLLSQAISVGLLALGIAVVAFSLNNENFFGDFFKQFL